MSKPVILVTGNYTEAKVAPFFHRYNVRQDHFTSIERVGGLPVLTGFLGSKENIQDLLSQVDGLLVTGGDDIEPGEYGEEKRDVCGETCPPRDKFERMLIEAALEMDKPLFFICRGTQMLNVVLGGTLHQDLKTDTGTDIAHLDIPNYDNEKAHTVKMEAGSKIAGILGKTEFGVNTLHHQAVKDVAPGLKVAGRAPDGTVEALEVPGKHYVVACQWHPEMMLDTEHNVKLFTDFVAACAEARKKRCP